MSSDLYCQCSGRGEPVVLLHGWGMNHLVFDALRARIESHCEVRALDLPGHGASPWSDAWDRQGQLELIAASIPPRATVVGWSLGGQIALELAHRCAARALVLLATTPRFIRGDGWEQGLPPQTLQQFAAALERDAHATLVEFLGLQVRGSAGATAVHAALQAAIECGGMARIEALRSGLEALRHNDLRESARHLDLPALVVCGQNDAVMPGAGPALAQLLPRAHLVQLARAGHVPFVSHTEQVAEALLQFLGMAASP